MENRRYVKIIFSFLFLFCAILGLSPSFSFAYDDQKTHPALTKEIVNFHNLFSLQKISETNKQAMMQGSIDEDIFPRYFNHFYDPVYDRGWMGYTSSKVWAKSSSVQSSQKYLAGSFITIDDPGDYSWERALKDWAKGDEKRAFLALGHILHLLEDSSVPEHTRGDTHIGHGQYGSPLENWAGKFTPQNVSLANEFYQEGLEPIRRNSMDDYFNATAKYSNNNFFSEDTIQDSRYQLPKIIKEIFEINDNGEKEKYGYSIDENGKEFKLVFLSKVPVWRNFNNKQFGTLTNRKILTEYWNHLSRKVLTEGAGLVEVFLQEAGIARKVYQEELAARSKKSFFEKVLGFFSPEPAILINPRVLAEYVREIKGAGNLRTVREITQPNTKLASANVQLPEKEIDTDNDDKEDERFEQLLVAQNEISNFQIPMTNEIPMTNFQTPTDKPQTPITNNQPAPSIIPQIIPRAVAAPAVAVGGGSLAYYKRGDVVFSEVAWMGTTTSANHEWIELKNATDKQILLQGFSLVTGDGSLLVGENGDEFKEGAVIPPQGYFLLERDEAATSVRADKIYDGSLSNAGETLVVKDGNGNEIDRVDMQKGWQAGKNEIAQEGYKPTISLILGIWQDGVPTPKAQNIKTQITNKPQNPDEKNTNEQKVSFPPQSVVFSEIAWMGDERSFLNEWMELYNNATSTIDLLGWHIQAQDGAPNIALSGLLAPQTYFLLERTDDDSAGGVFANGIYTGALENTGETLLLKDPAGNEIDKVEAWYAGDDTTKKTMQKDTMSLARNDASNWFSASATPKAANQRDPLSPLPPPSPPAPPASSYQFHDVVINEVAWMGTLGDGGDEDEWIELKSATSTALTLSGWTLTIASNASSTPKFSISFDASDVIPANGFFVLERNSSSTIKNIDGKVYEGSKSAMPNSGGYLTLVDPSGNVIDIVDGSKKWPAGDGDKTKRKSMERSGDFASWYTFSKMSSDNDKGDMIIGREDWPIIGTPGCPNSKEAKTCAVEAFPN